MLEELHEPMMKMDHSITQSPGFSESLLLLFLLTDRFLEVVLLLARLSELEENESAEISGGTSVKTTPACIIARV